MSHQNPNPQNDETGKTATKNKRDRPFKIEARYRPGSWFERISRKGNPWFNYKPKGYCTAQERDAALDNARRKYAGFMEFRNPDDTR